MQNLSFISNGRGETSTRIHDDGQLIDRSGTRHRYIVRPSVCASNGVDSSSCVLQFIIVDQIDGSLFSLARFHPPPFVLYSSLLFLSRLILLLFALFRAPKVLLPLTKFARLFLRGTRNLKTFSLPLLPSPTVYLTFREIKC